MAATTPDVTTVPTGYVNIGTEFSLMAYCPTYMNFEQSDLQPHSRQAESIYFRGVTEKVSLAVTGPGTIYWRRICFWHHAEVEAAIPIQSSLAAQTYFRPLNLLDPTTGDGSYLLRLIFQGQRNIDWVNYMNATIDHRRIKLHSDRTRSLQATVSHPDPIDPTQQVPSIHRRYVDRQFPNKMVTYDDEESGPYDITDPTPSTEGNPWSSDKGRSYGNFYIVDLFSFNGSNETDVVPEGYRLYLQMDSVRYWNEK